MKRNQSHAMVYSVLVATTVFAALYSRYLYFSLDGVYLSWFVIGLVSFKFVVEIVASYYGFAFVFTAIAYLVLKEIPHRMEQATHCPPVGIIYLCCEDLDVAALASLTELKYRGKVYLLIHDDSKSLTARAEVDAAVERLRKQSQWQCMVLRRKCREGGKPGALNYVLEQTGHLYDYFLLCDNDSTALDPLSIEKAIPYFQDKQTAIVQCRSVAVDSFDYSPINRLLARSIDSFHVFFAVQSRFGWQPFIGHNAFLRTSAVKAVGGFTPGFFSDDLDLTVRLNLKGCSVAHAPEIQIGEKHPPSYASFRKRTYKWTYGCMQVLKAHTRAVLTSPHFSVAEKLSFFHFTGSYVGQTLLLLYLTITFLIEPLFQRIYPLSLLTSLIWGSIMMFIIYLPTVVYFVKEARMAGCMGTVIACGMVYGASDFSCARGVWDCIWSREKEWTPTNSTCHDRSSLALFGEALFGTLLLCVPALMAPAMLYCPTTFLFGGKFLFGPAISLLYDDGRKWLKPFTMLKLPQGASAFLAIVVLAFTALASSHANQHESKSTGVQIRDKDIYVDGKKYLAKGISYGPWRPGTGPNKGYPYPSPKEIEEDLTLMDKLNANTLVIYDPPDYVLDLAEQHGFKVLYCFSINWWTIGSPDFASDEQKILQRVEELQKKPALIGWILGNEIPTAVLSQRGDQTIINGLADLYHAVKKKDGLHPITHSNWVFTKDLNLSFLDFVSFNLYPLWPPEVVAHGYGNYIKEFLQPIASNKPLLITEFGANTIEASPEAQARLIKRCWQDILQAGTSGGVAFEFADQWWKIYDNPHRPGDWWNRIPAPEDEKTDDLDPEEHYGLVTAHRQPKPAFDAVAQIYAIPKTAEDSHTVPFAITASLILVASTTWLWAKRNTRPSSGLTANLGDATRGK